MEEQPLKVNPGDILSADSWNKLVEAVCGSGSVGAGMVAHGGSGGSGFHVGLAKQPDDYWVGKVVHNGPNGEQDYTDYRYWVQRQRLTTTGDLSQKLQWEADSYPFNQIVTASNIQELITGSHFLKVGTIVQVFEEYDLGIPTQIRYKCEAVQLSFIGKIVASGPGGAADFHDNRYWVQPQFISSTGASNIVTGTNMAMGVICVTNWAEKASITHLLEIGDLIEVWFAVADSGDAIQYWTQFTPRMRIGTYCPTNESDDKKCGQIDQKEQFALSFHTDDFLVTTCDDEEWRSKVQWKGFSVAGYADALVCNTYILKFDQTNAMSFGETAGSVSSTYNNYRYDVQFTVTEADVSDPCPVCDPIHKAEAVITGKILIDPCTFTTSFVDCNDNPLGKFPTVKFGKGLTTATEGSCSSSGQITITVGLTMAAGLTDYASIDDSMTDCTKVLTLHPCAFLPNVSGTGVTAKPFKNIAFDSTFTVVDDGGTCPSNTITVTAKQPTGCSGSITLQTGTSFDGSTGVLSQTTRTLTIVNGIITDCGSETTTPITTATDCGDDD